MVGLSCLVATTPHAHAHPHVWVTMTSELLYAPDGSVTGVRHAWTFDDMFSAFATQGLEQKTKGQFTREELQSLAKVNVELLQEYAYFTYLKVNGKRQKDALSDPIDYYLEYDPKETVLTALHASLQDPGEGQGARRGSLRSRLLHRLRLRRKGSGAAGQRAGAMFSVRCETA